MSNEWLQGAAYQDDKGNMYKVLPGRGNIGYRARCARHQKAGWAVTAGLPWRPTSEQAQWDLDQMAAQKGWTKI